MGKTDMYTIIAYITDMAITHFYFSKSSVSMLRALRFHEVTHHVLWVAALAIDGIVHLPHFLVGYLPRQFTQDGSKLRMPFHSRFPHHGHSFVRREIMAVVFEHRQLEGGDQSVGRVAGHQVHLLLRKCAIE